VAYQDDLSVSEAARQQAHKAATTDAQHRQADIDHYTRLVTAGRKWNVRNEAMQALLNLGAAPPAGSFTPTDF
jgi:hypothetical protein